MKRFYFLLITVLFINCSFAQNISALGILGEAKKKVTPDVAVISIYLSAKDKAESVSYKQLTDISNATLNKLKSLGFKNEQIKITDFSISSRTEWVKTTSYKTWVASQSFIVKFPLDKQKLLDTYENFLSDTVKGTSLSFDMECSDVLKEKTQNELIEAAIDNANARANIIAKKTNQTITGIRTIQYKYSGNDDMDRAEVVRFTPPRIVADYALKRNSEEMSNLFSIIEVEFSEVINISYNLKPAN